LYKVTHDDLLNIVLYKILLHTIMRLV